jgi:uncharacterized repeat protein (TIGR01451 family)
LNTKLFGSSTNNAQCVSFHNLALGGYYYGQESMGSSSSPWATPKYNDQYQVAANSPSDFFTYDGQLFDADASNDAARNLNADGDIELSVARPDRTLIVLNQYLGTPATTTPTSTLSALINFGGIEDLPGTIQTEQAGDYNDVIFSFSSSTPVTVVSDNGVLNPLTANLVNNSGNLYWDNPSLDGAGKNIGYCVLGNGACPTVGGPYSNVQYLAGPSGVQIQNALFNASGSVTMTLFAKITAFNTTDALGWYDPAHPSVLHPIFTGPAATGTSVTFTPSSVFGLYLDNGHGGVFSSQNAANVGDTNKQHFALFAVTPTIATTTPTSTPSADLSVSKTVDNAAPHEGDTVHYTVTVSALGPATSTGVVATDTLPSGLTFANATASVGTYASSTGTWTIGDLAASSTATLQIAAQVNAGTAGQTILNSAIAGENASTTDPNLVNNSSTVSLTVQSNVCTSNCGGGGTPATSTLTVNVTGLNASDTAALAVQDITASTTQATSTGNGSSTFVLSTNDSYAVTATTTAANYTVATSTGCSGTILGNVTCNITFTQNVPSTDADISIVKTVSNASPVAGDTVTYVVTVSAQGPATSTIVSAHDQLPIGLSFTSATTSVGAYNMGTGDWSIGMLSPNATATLTIVAVVGGDQAGKTITNTATVSQLSSLVDPDLANNSSSVAVNVQPAPCTSNCGGGGGGGGNVPTAEIGIAKTVDNANPKPGDTIHYTLTVSALGPSASFGVVATDTLPAGVTFVSASSSMGTYNSTTGTWTIGSVANGTSQTLVITATVNAGDVNGQTITNTATVGESNSVNDPLTGNNTASVTITVGGSNGGGGGGSVTVGGGPGDGGQVLGASASCGLYLTQYIHPVRKDLNDPTEVKKLQTFLNMNLGSNLPVTGYYGPQTIAAVDQFQVKYHSEVLQPWLNYGLPTEYTPTQYVYKTTQRWINLIMCSSLNLPIPQLP